MSHWPHRESFPLYLTSSTQMLGRPTYCFSASKETQPSQNFPTPGNESLSNNHSRSLIGLPVHKNCGYCRSSYLSSFFKLFANRAVEESQLSKKKEGRKDRNLVTHRLPHTQAIHKTKCSVQFLHRKAKNHQLLVCLSSATGVKRFKTPSIWNPL